MVDTISVFTEESSEVSASGSTLVENDEIAEDRVCSTLIFEFFKESPYLIPIPQYLLVVQAVRYSRFLPNELEFEDNCITMESVSLTWQACPSGIPSKNL